MGRLTGSLEGVLVRPPDLDFRGALDGLRAPLGIHCAPHLFLCDRPGPDGSIKVMSIVFPLFGLPFVLIGLGMMGAPFWAWWKARRTVFVLSDQRVATALAGRTFNVASVDLAWIASVHRQEKRNGSGTLNHGMGPCRDFDGDKVKKTVVTTGVPDIAELERLIAGTIRSRRALRDDGSNGANA